MAVNDHRIPSVHTPCCPTRCSYLTDLPLRCDSGSKMSWIRQVNSTSEASAFTA